MWRDQICSTFVDLDCERTRDELFFGDVTSTAASGLQFSYVTSTEQQVVRSPSRISHAAEEHFLLVIQLHGEGHAHQSSREAHTCVGDMTLYYTGQPYTLSFKDDFRQFVVKIPAKKLRQRITRPEDATGMVLNRENAAVRLARRYVRDFVDSSGGLDGEVAAGMANAGLDVIALAIQSASASGRPQIAGGPALLLKRMQYFIRDNLADPRLSAASVAAAHHISPRYASMLFEKTGTSLSRTIWAARLDAAAADLLNPVRRQQSICEIAFFWGFNDSAHFSRAFKANFGLSPRDFRLGHCQGRS